MSRSFPVQRLTPFLSSTFWPRTNKWLIYHIHSGLAANLTKIKFVSPLFSCALWIKLPFFISPFFPNPSTKNQLIPFFSSTFWPTAAFLQRRPLEPGLLFCSSGAVGSTTFTKIGIFHLGPSAVFFASSCRNRHHH